VCVSWGRMGSNLILLSRCVCMCVRLGFELKSFALTKQALYCLSHASSPLCSGYFGDGPLELFAWAGLEP
jgi:hypothetical protein